jgi:hypothetical protein
MPSVSNLEKSDLQMGTCYMSRGYGGVRKLLKEYGLDDQEVEFGGNFKAGTDEGGPERIVRMVWDLKHANDLRRDRAGGLGQDFDDWVLSAAASVSTSPRRTTPTHRLYPNRQKFQKHMQSLQYLRTYVLVLAVLLGWRQRPMQHTRQVC